MDEELCLRQQLSRISYNFEWRYAQSSNLWILSLVWVE